MRAARYYGPGDVRVEDIPEPETRKGQVKIKVRTSRLVQTTTYSTPNADGESLGCLVRESDMFIGFVHSAHVQVDHIGLEVGTSRIISQSIS